MGCDRHNTSSICARMMPDRRGPEARSSLLSGRRAGMRMWAVLLMTMAICAYARGASGDESSVPQAGIDPKVVNLQVTEGTDIRFARLSRAQGISQTRVE